MASLPLQKLVLVLFLLKLTSLGVVVEGHRELRNFRRHPQGWNWWSSLFPNPWNRGRPTNNTPAPSPAPSPPPPTPSPSPSGQQPSCTNMIVRREWRSLSRDEQTNYINAVKCLAKLPSKLLPGGDYRRYDDFENVHSRMRTRIHWLAIFLPWHREFMFLYEQALRNECQYTGGLPRWDWTLDSANMTDSPIWSADSQVGFGGNGRDFINLNPAIEGGIVTDGAFANFSLYYPEFHRLQRNYNLPARYQLPGRSWGSQYFDSAAITRIQGQTDYARFAVALEGTDPSSTGPSNPGPHSIIHVVLGGDLSPTAYAANEPLFYLHHSNVDWHWWKWQNAQRSSRLYAYGGPVTRGSTRNEARLTDALAFLNIGSDLRVRDVMDTSSGRYCYRYE